MNKNTFVLIILICFGLSGCNSRSDSPGNLKKIDMNQAFNQTKSVKLSDLVKSVEIVQFYPPEDTYFVNARSFAVGKKYILIADDRGGGSSNVFLCERSGKFVTTIGRSGKGPGEFLNAWLVLMDPSESCIIIADDRSGKLIKYSVAGKFISEHKIEELPGRFILDEARFINKDEFVLVPRRPVRGIEGFASMLIYDLDLNPTGKILARANDKNLPLFNNSYQVLGAGPDRTFYWEPWFDTLYTVNPDHSAVATHIIGWSKDGPTFDYLSSFTYKLPPEQQYPVNFIISITESSKYLFLSGSSHQKGFSAAYDKKTEEVFLLSDVMDCDTSSREKYAVIQNDLFGFDPIYFQTFEKQANRFVSWLRLGMTASSFDLVCIQSKEVKFPEIRDRLIELTQSPDVDNNLVLVLMEAK